MDAVALSPCVVSLFMSYVVIETGLLCMYMYIMAELSACYVFSVMTEAHDKSACTRLQCPMLPC